MTTVAQWDEIVSWVEEHWPETPWTGEQAAAYYEDLRQFDEADVWQALFQHYSTPKDARFPPTDLYARTVEVARANARAERRGLPPSTGELTVTWEQYAKKTYGSTTISLLEAGRLEHELLPDCRSPLCDIHREGG